MIATGFMGEFNYTVKGLVSLAEAVPAEKYSWRPAEGARSISEVYVHIAIGNIYFLTICGAKVDTSRMTGDAEKRITAKADVIALLNESVAAVRENYPRLDLQKKVEFLRAETTVDAVMIHLLAHTSEHWGQSMAYARMNGIAPGSSR